MLILNNFVCIKICVLPPITGTHLHFGRKNAYDISVFTQNETVFQYFTSEINYFVLIFSKTVILIKIIMNQRISSPIQKECLLKTSKAGLVLCSFLRWK